MTSLSATAILATNHVGHKMHRPHSFSMLATHNIRIGHRPYHQTFVSQYLSTFLMSRVRMNWLLPAFETMLNSTAAIHTCYLTSRFRYKASQPLLYAKSKIAEISIDNRRPYCNRMPSRSLLISLIRTVIWTQVVNRPNHDVRA